jgi:hypothetical protein
MKIKVLTCIRNRGTSKANGAPYDFLVVGGLIQTERGSEMAELMLDGTAPPPQVEQVYNVEVQPYADREKKLKFRVAGLSQAK